MPPKEKEALFDFRRWRTWGRLVKKLTGIDCSREAQKKNNLNGDLQPALYRAASRPMRRQRGEPQLGLGQKEPPTSPKSCQQNQWPPTPSRGRRHLPLPPQRAAGHLQVDPSELPYIRHNHRFGQALRSWPSGRLRASV